jgi:hypothetical protein
VHQHQCISAYILPNCLQRSNLRPCDLFPSSVREGGVCGGVAGEKVGVEPRKLLPQDPRGRGLSSSGEGRDYCRTKA